MSKFPEYLEEWLNVVELNIHLDRSPDKAQTLVNGLRERIERYADERESQAVFKFCNDQMQAVDRAIQAERLTRLPLEGGK